MAEPTTRTAIVFGGSGGIGRAVVERLAHDGQAVVVHYSGSPDKAQAAVEAVEAAGGTAIAAGGDVADEHAVADVFDQAESRFGGVDVVVNASGIMLLGPLADFDLDALDRMHRINIRGSFVVAQQAVRRVRSGGAIIGFSTSVTRLSFPGYAPYAASKAAVEALTTIMARELRGRDITANAVAPGPTATPLFLTGKDDAAIDQLAHAAPLERLGQPEDIADVVSFLAGPDGRWVNGQTVFANGGLA